MGLAIALTTTLDKIAKSVILDFNFLNICRGLTPAGH